MDQIELARYYDDIQNRIVIITISDYNNMRENKDRDGLSSFIYNRLISRYMRPFSYNNHDYKKRFKNGFSMMANLCLLIETLQSFKNGWEDSEGKSRDAFAQFFQDNSYFVELSNESTSFYRNVRCGILHQGETTGGWKVSREGKDLYDQETKKINSVVFSDRMEQLLLDYKTTLKNSDWDSEIWNNFRTKMERVINNCMPPISG